MQPFSPCSIAFLASVERTITRERLNRYLGAANQDLPLALELYEKNVALSEALYGLLHWLEVAVRNSARQALTNGYGTPVWYDCAPLTKHWEDEIAKAKKKGKGVPGKVVAELTFWFWADLSSKQNNNTLWVGRGLRRAFPNAALKRAQIHQRLKSVQLLRNRVSHPERVLTSSNTMYNGLDFITLPELLECVEWNCGETAKWMKVQRRYGKAVHILAEIHAGMAAKRWRPL